ncbi:MAG: FecR domain-containing protein, partial [Balneolaceae bacterium]
MENFDKSLLKKYFNNSTTAEEAEEVLDWFETPEGRDYLSEKIDSDIQSISDEKIHCRVTDIDADKMLGAVRKRIKSKRHVPRRVYGVTKTVLRVAASALVILTASLFYYTAYDRQAPDAEEPTPAYYATSATEQKDVTLSDGTRIRLNSNSQIQLPVSLEEGRRGVVLTGEAYFDVAHDPERPFIIHTEESEIEVLGTS